MSLELILGPVLLNVFIENLLVKVSALGKFAKNTRSDKVADVLEGKAAI